MSIKLINGVFKWPISLFETMKIILQGLKIKNASYEIITVKLKD